ncbi:MAG: heme biosynthesis protein HemY [Pikeienuella sp.]
MITMLIRTAIWVAVILIASIAIVFLMSAEGGVTIDLNRQTYGPFAPMEFAIGVLLLTAVLWLAWRIFGLIVAIVRFVSGDETALSRYWFRSQERRGFDALAEGQILLAEGDGKTALARARKAERLLARPALTNLLVAQAAEATGDRTTARTYYKTMAGEKGSAFVGVRGLLAQAQASNEPERALKLAEHAFTLKPKDSDVLNTLFGLQAGQRNWAGARKTLTAMARAGALPRDVAGRREAVLLLADARAALAKDNEDEARDLALLANKKAPGLGPAAALAAQLSMKNNAPRLALRIIKEAWRQSPHPDLAAAFAAMAPDEDAAARRKRFRDLINLTPDHAEAQALKAELALADNDLIEARRVIAPLVEDKPTLRALSILAAIEKADGADDLAIRGFLARAATAPRGSQWLCGACGAHHAEWTPVCDNCDAFDALDWREDPLGDDQSAAESMILPLVAGAASADAVSAADGDVIPADS